MRALYFTNALALSNSLGIYFYNICFLFVLIAMPNYKVKNKFKHIIIFIGINILIYRRMLNSANIVNTIFKENNNYLREIKNINKKIILKAKEPTKSHARIQSDNKKNRKTYRTTVFSSFPMRL